MLTGNQKPHQPRDQGTRNWRLQRPTSSASGKKAVRGLPKKSTSEGRGKQQAASPTAVGDSNSYVEVQTAKSFSPPTKEKLVLEAAPNT